MSLLEVYEGRLPWAEYLKRHRGVAGRDTPPVDALAEGVAQLNADFTPLLGDVIWKLEMHHSSLLEALQEIRLAEFEREARAYRMRAERAYQNGWYEEALRDFLKAEKRNYPDYAVLRSIAVIYLYHLIDLPKALIYFQKAAKYARPSDSRQAAEAHYFAGVICLIDQDAQAAEDQFTEAIKLHQQFYEAYYQLGGAAALLGKSEDAIRSLETAIRGDARYYERVKTDPLFDSLRPEVEALLERLLLPVKESVEQMKRDAAQLEGFVIAESERGKIDAIFRQIEEQQGTEATYRERLQMLEELKEFHEELQHIHERFDRRYVIDPRDYVRSIAFSHSGQWLAAGFLNGGVQLWEVDSMEQLKVFGERPAHAHLASVNSVAFSPNDLLLASASRDRTIKLWEADEGRELQILKGHTGDVSAVAFSPDGQWLVSGSHDKTIRIWRAATGHEVETLNGHSRPVTSIVLSPNGKLLASGSWDHTIMLWDLSSGRARSILTGHSKGVASLAISPDGRRLASGGESGEVKLWDLQSGVEIRNFKVMRNSVTSLAFSPDGALLAAGSLGVRIMVWKTATSEIVRELQYDNISYNSVAFSPRGQWLALGSRDLQLWLKVILTEEEYAAVKAGEQRAVRAARERDEKLQPGYVSLLK